jgi:hypothetical protein
MSSAVLLLGNRLVYEAIWRPAVKKMQSLGEEEV